MTEREWHPPGLVRQFFRLAPWGFPRQILMILAEGDKTLPEIIEGFNRFMVHFGYFGRADVVAGFTKERFIASFREAIHKLEREEAVVQCDGVYSLTPKGQLRAKKMQSEFKDFGEWIERLLHPQMVSLVSLGVHLIFAILKLLAGAISGSIGLISDGMDTAMDGFSSILVFLGLRLKKEQLVNVVLVLLMLGVGIGTSYEAVKRVFIPKEVEVDLLTFAIAILSGLVCLILSLYQRYVGTRTGQQPIIAQAVDSRNHAFVALGVIIGLVATLLQFPLLDTLVGLMVAGLILKSGGELAIETMRALRGEEVDFSRYELGFVEEYRRFRKRYLADWLLVIIAEGGPEAKSTLLTHCRKVLDTQDVPIIRELGWGKGHGLEREIESALDILLEQGFIVMDGEMLDVTKKAHTELESEAWG
jgi:hypothetical protein